jgi:DNA helicase HerA-like ATPase
VVFFFKVSLSILKMKSKIKAKFKLDHSTYFLEYNENQGRSKMSTVDFKKCVDEGYNFKGKSLLLGAAILEKHPVAGATVLIPLKTLSQHGLIAGATGTGKTKTIQSLAEALSQEGISTLLMDIKGDLSGLAKAGTPNDLILARLKNINADFKPSGYPVELLTISHEKGVCLRATVSEFGPLLFSKILELNESQQGLVTVVFKYADDKKLPLLDIKDFRAVLDHLSKTEDANPYGGISKGSSGVVLRKLLELEEQGGDLFFGEKSFDVIDLMKKDDQGRGTINILRLTDIQNKPKLFSTFMLCLLAELYAKLPEMGDLAAPKLVLFIDEAHLIFKDATKALLDQLEMIVKLIRSKGVGLFFCTQVPSDIPERILSQLGAKIQHALRAFTAKDRKDIKLVAENYPTTSYYKVNELLTELGVGEALVTVLNEKGIPTPLVQCQIVPPSSRMGVLSEEEIDSIVNRSNLAKEYNQSIDRESAYELLTGKIQAPPESAVQKQQEEAGFDLLGTMNQVSKNPLVKSVANTVVRSLLGVIFGNPKK